MRVIVVAGGTGGHIYPALAIINKLKQLNNNLDVLYIGNTDRMEKDIIPSLGIPFKGIEMSGMNRKNPLKNISVYVKYKRAYEEALKIVGEYKPDIVIGVGGYISLPVIKAAHTLGIKSIIHEQNAIPGLSNRILSKYTDKICVSLPNSVKYFPKDKVIYTGNPRSEEIIDIKTIRKDTLGYDEAKPLVIFVMGSLGSTTMTTKIKELIPKFKDKTYQVLIITGKAYYDDYKDIEVSSNVKLMPFYNDLIALMKDSNLMVSRAGASTIAEITAIGIPSILVPSPYVTHNHQYKNALELESIGASKIIEEKDFTSNIVLSTIDNILSNKELYNKMHEASLKLGVKDSATKICREIEAMVNDR
jgi:UDP-N-acetylglucosamine--N-acetylmuramyl-(pentapeptide) pyrophosphoryl-undecaprenol N-acetylglucosamine transferase